MLSKNPTFSSSGKIGTRDAGSSSNPYSESGVTLHRYIGIEDSATESESIADIDDIAIDEDTDDGHSPEKIMICEEPHVPVSRVATSSILPMGPPPAPRLQMKKSRNAYRKRPRPFCRYDDCEYRSITPNSKFCKSHKEQRRRIRDQCTSVRCTFVRGSFKCPRVTFRNSACRKHYEYLKKIGKG